jgi:hypothetical protein
VLQDIAVARSILILCGQKDLDGQVFYAGLHKVAAIEGSNHPVVNLIGQVNSWSARLDTHKSVQGPNSLGVARFSTLIGHYYHQEASRQQDKIYALPGMCTDDLQKADLSPDYTAP